MKEPVDNWAGETERKRPAAVDEIVAILNLEALVILAVACIILVFDIAANARSDIAFDVHGVPGVIVGALGLFLVKLTRDFRSLRKWTLPYVRRVLGLFGSSRYLAKKLDQPSMRKAFGLAPQDSEQDLDV